ncbi:hypothetical protein C8R44DRAFT_901648 [Mycena epipterygia]|nr:hypothetical protein C8R44DRAFT_901648 [Mycena epipterygia]
MLPALEGLLPETHNDIVLTLWFVLATWHAYAKLRLHSSSTIKCFRAVTTELGAKARHFICTTCNTYVTYELPQETKRRARREASKKSASAKKASNGPKKRKSWNISTYKYHSLGDYPDTIIQMGTTDSYSTQIGELAHHLVKRFYARTNRRNYGQQIAAHECRQRMLRCINRRMDDAAASEAAHAAASADEQHAEPAHPTNPLAESLRPSSENFLSNLRKHLLSRLLGLPYDGDEQEFSPQELMDVTIVGDRLYTHKVMRVNFTTYDCKEIKILSMFEFGSALPITTINPRTHSDLMVLAHEDDMASEAHPYWYARVIGIFHAEVRHVGPRSKSRKPVRMEFLWVRWFGRDLSYKAGWKAKRLHRLGFIDSADGGAFGFLDPAEVIRGAHIIPAFHYGRTSELLPKSIARRPEENDEDYLYYYVNCFVDRDMFMRYCDHAIGHKTMKTTANSSPGRSTTVDEDDEMDVDPEEAITTQPANEEEVPEPDDPTEDLEGDKSESESSDEEDELDGVDTENEGNDEEEIDDDGAGAAKDDEEIIDEAGYDTL